MIRRYPCQIVLLYVLGILAAVGCSEWGPVSGLSVCAAAVSGVLWICREPAGRRRLRQAVLLLAAFSAGVARMHAVSADMEYWSAGLSDGEKISVQGCITKKKLRETQIQETKVKENQWTVHLSDSYLKTSQGIRSCGNVIVYLSSNQNIIQNINHNIKINEPMIGNTIVVSGKIKLFQSARNEGNFDERAYYQNQGYAFKVYGDSSPYRTADAHVDQFRNGLYSIQQSLLQVYQEHMPEEEAGALSAMLLGEKSLLLDETKELYQQSGIAHILAISGLHISILGAAVYRLLRKRGISFHASALLSMSLLISFGFMTGMGISTARAVVMFGIYLGAACCGRAYDSVNGLALAAAVILAQNPRALFLAGFQFSFAAVAGVLFGREICRIFQPKFRLAETVWMSFGIQMLTLPLTAWYYFEFPMYSILLNMLVLPLMALVLVTGLFGGGFGLVSYAASGTGFLGAAAGRFCGLASSGLLHACSLVLRYFSKMGNLFLKLPGAVYTAGQPSGWKMAVYYLILGGCVWMLYVIERKGERDAETSNDKRRR